MKSDSFGEYRTHVYGMLQVFGIIQFQDYLYQPSLCLECFSVHLCISVMQHCATCISWGHVMKLQMSLKKVAYVYLYESFVFILEILNEVSRSKFAEFMYDLVVAEAQDRKIFILAVLAWFIHRSSHTISLLLLFLAGVRHGVIGFIYSKCFHSLHGSQY